MVFFRKGEEGQPKPVTPELSARRAALEQAPLPDNIRAVAVNELERLEKSDPSLASYSLGLDYLDCLLSLPWQRGTEDNLDLRRAERLLEAEHYGLLSIKKRLLEYLAVRTLCSLQSSRILVVDDEEIARTNLEYILRKEGHQVATAANGLDALEEVKARKFDVVLTDLKMDTMDGLQLLESVKQVSPTTEVILVTGFATVGTAVDALKKGAAHYLSKPIKLDEMRAAIREIIDRKHHFQLSRGPLLCFAGPPATGKTSMGRALAAALERRFVHLSLAGLRDEAELRGRPRTEAGAQPGRIISEVRRLGVNNPVFLLSDIDKIGRDFRGDLAAVLLEILDPRENAAFTDRYLNVSFDLSAVMFIVTANVMKNLPAPLLNRLEVIDFPGYGEAEKRQIARRHLIPRSLRDHGLGDLAIAFTDDAIDRIMREYTREAGLGGLESQIAAICRALARLCVQDRAFSCAATIDAAAVAEYLGPPKYRREVAGASTQVGVTTGLIWTEFGGEAVTVEAAAMKGGKQLILTGSRRHVLRESAHLALSYIRSHAASLGIDPDFFAATDLHVQVSAGALPQEGPAVGVAVALALISLLTGRPARREVALTGELTLNGRLLPVGGVREKVLAAQRAGVRTVVFSQENACDINVLEESVRGELKIILADALPDLLDVVLLPQ